VVVVCCQHKVVWCEVVLVCCEMVLVCCQHKLVCCELVLVCCETSCQLLACYGSKAKSVVAVSPCAQVNKQSKATSLQCCLRVSLVNSILYEAKQQQSRFALGLLDVMCARLSINITDYVAQSN